MKEANVSELKAHLSAYLAAVRHGETIVVRDRRTPIARLVPFDEGANDLSISEPAQPTRTLRPLAAPRLRRRVDVVRLLRDSRDQR